MDRERRHLHRTLSLSAARSKLFFSVSFVSCGPQRQPSEESSCYRWSEAVRGANLTFLVLL